MKVSDRGGVDKKLYLQLMREGYLHCLPEIQEVLKNNDECEQILITKDGCILDRKNGSKLYFDFAQAICRAEVELVTEGDPEHDEMELVNRFLSDTDAQVVFDVGANVGLYSLDLYQDHKAITYYLFEPVPDTFAVLQRTVELNKVDPAHFKPYNLGMSNQKGTVTFYVPAANEAASMVANEDAFYRKRSNSTGEYTGQNDIRQVKCSVITLDDFTREHTIDRIDFLKIDVLEGAAETLKRFQPLVYTELLRKHAKRFGYHPNDVIHFMQTLGYECATMQDGKLKKIDTITEETVQTNFFFLSGPKHGSSLY